MVLSITFLVNECEELLANRVSGAVREVAVYDWQQFTCFVRLLTNQIKESGKRLNRYRCSGFASVGYVAVFALDITTVFSTSCRLCSFLSR